MIRNIIFDWSGTLVDDLPAVWEATNHVFKLASVPTLSLNQFRADFTLPFVGFYQRFVPHIPIQQLEQWFHHRFKEVQDHVSELPHARKFLEACKRRGQRTFVLSTIRSDHYATQCARTGLNQYIDRAYLEAWDKTQTIGKLLTDNGLNPLETLFVGDMQHDIETAKHGGVHSCAVLTGYTPLHLLQQCQPNMIVEHLGELLAILDQHEWNFPVSPAVNSTGKFPIPTVGALILNSKGEALMIRTQKWSNRWGIPGGKIQYSETCEAALIREIKEETNLGITNPRFIMVQDCIEPKEFYRRAHFLLLNYVATVDGPTEVQLNHEAQEFKWVSLSRALELDLNIPTRVLINQVMDSAQVEPT